MGKRVALLVGCDRYADKEIRDLACAEEDAISLRILLELHARFDTVRLVRQPDADTVLDAAEQLTGGLAGGDLFLFFFAGHGVELDGEHLLLTPNVRWRRLRRMKQHAIPMEALKDATDGPADRLFILDACRSDLLADRRGAPTGTDAQEALRTLVVREARKPHGSTTVLCSCEAGEQATEIPELRRGLFSLAFEQLLQEHVSNGEAVALSSSFQNALATRMGELATTHGVGSAQQPWIAGGPRRPVLVAGHARAVPPPSPTVHCPSCDQMNPGSAQFCESCGEPVASDCPECGTRTHVDAPFCTACGTDLAAFTALCNALADGAEQMAKRHWQQVIEGMPALTVAPQLPGAKGRRALEEARLLGERAGEKLRLLMELRERIAEGIAAQELDCVLDLLDQHDKLAPEAEAEEALREQVRDARALVGLSNIRDRMQKLIGRREFAAAEQESRRAKGYLDQIAVRGEENPVLRDSGGSLSSVTAESLELEIGAEWATIQRQREQAQGEQKQREKVRREQAQRDREKSAKATQTRRASTVFALGALMSIAGVLAGIVSAVVLMRHSRHPHASQISSSTACMLAPVCAAAWGGIVRYRRELHGVWILVFIFFAFSVYITLALALPGRFSNGDRIATTAGPIFLVSLATAAAGVLTVISSRDASR